MKDISRTNNEYFDINDGKRLARMLMLSRAESGLSQEKVALEMCIAKKTVQNWENGVSAPSLPQAIEWFRVLGVPAMPYFLQFMFPDMEGTSSKDSDEKLRIELIQLMETLPSEGIRQLMYLFYGNHGSSPRAVLNMTTAHLQTPIRERYNHASTILSDYEINLATNKTTKPEHAQPNLALLENAIAKSREAIINNKNSYNLTK